jgi:hypothetical protein
MEKLVKPLQSVKQEETIGIPSSTPGIEPESPKVKRALFSPIPENEVLELVKDKFAKESIIRTANSTVQLSTTNGEFFVAKFMDYLESLGLKQAVLATRAQCIDPETNKATEQANKSRISIHWKKSHPRFVKSFYETTANMKRPVIFTKRKVRNVRTLDESCILRTFRKIFFGISVVKCYET